MAAPVNPAPYRAMLGRQYGSERNPQVAVRFDRDTFSHIEAVARARNIAFGAVVRELVSLGIAWQGADPE